MYTGQWRQQLYLSQEIILLAPKSKHRLLEVLIGERIGTCTSHADA